MIGERLVLDEAQHFDAKRAFQLVSQLSEHEKVVVVAIAGESGSGKTCLAHLLARQCCVDL